jgi:hypothetical protein
VRLVERGLVEAVSPPARAVYEYLRRSAADGSSAPGVAQIREALGLQSHAALEMALAELERVALIVRDPAEPGVIVLACVA